MIVKVIDVWEGDITALAKYIAGVGSEKASNIRFTNDPSYDVLDFATRFKFINSLNTRSEAAKYMHLVISFSKEENITPEQMQYAEDIAVSELGLNKHQRMSAIHEDTDHQHMHVMINTIDLETTNNINPSFSHIRLQNACRKVEKELGLRVDLGNGNSQFTDLEYKTGEETFQGWMNRERKEDIEKLLDNSNNWDDFHKGLAKKGVFIKERGAGLVFGSNGRIYCKASNISREFSKKNLEKKLGKFKQRDKSVVVNKTYQYNAKGINDTKNLYAEYAKWAEDQKKERSRLNAQIKKASNEAYSKHKEKFYKRWTSIRGDRFLTNKTKQKAYTKISAEKKAELAKIKAAIAKDREQVNKKTRVVSWRQWLAEEAYNGNEEGLAYLRKTWKKKGTSEAGLTDLGMGSGRVEDDAVKVGQHGEVYYGERKNIIDYGSSIDISKHDDADIKRALELAKARYGDHLVIKGTPEFKAAVGRIAGENGLQISFADPRIEAIKLSSLIGKENTEKRQKQRNKPLDEYIEKRNKAASEYDNILLHRLKSEKDTGMAIYQGQRNISDTQKVALFELNNEMLVYPLSGGQTGNLKRVKVGSKVELTEKGFKTHKTKGVQR